MNSIFLTRILVLAGGLAVSATGFAAENPKLDNKAQQAAPTAFADERPVPVLNWGVGDGKSYFVPAGGIILFDLSLTLFNRTFIDSEAYGSNFDTFKENITGKWVYDDDPFDVNQFLHPYQGSMYHGFSRSAGLNFWEAMVYNHLGSVLWETAGEVEPPSINDQFTTGFGGTFLGEPLFRMASLFLESTTGRPGFWRELGAAALSPSTGFNRWFYGERFDGVFRSNNPAVYTRAQLGLNLTSSLKSNVNLNTEAEGDAVPQSYDKGEATADFIISYGLPGKPGYTYKRPFDYFHMQFTAATANVFENAIIRGLLYGAPYEVGDDYRGIWGIYGTYDYISPQIFRVSNTGAALGTTGQWWLSKTTALQGTLLAGTGYGSGGTVSSADERDYHDGVTPQAVVALRLIFSDRVSLDMTARAYHVSELGSQQDSGIENLAREEASLTVRVYNLHGITFKYVASQRDAKTVDRGDIHQRVGAFNISYSYLGQTRFGAVDWRPPSEGGPGSPTK